MEIKGTAVKTVPNYIKEKHQHVFEQWIESLPEQSRKIMDSPILSTEWYPLQEGIIIPMENLAKILSEEVNKVAWDMGAYSSQIALKGVYKIFVRIASPAFVIGRAANILETYYRPATINLAQREKGKIVLEFDNFLKADHLIMHRIAGWCYNTFEVVKAKNIEVNLKNVDEGGSNFKTLIIIIWE